MPQIWHVDAHGWWAQCEPRTYDKQPFVVRVTPHGELQIGEGLSTPVLRWQANGETTIYRVVEIFKG